MVKIIVSQDFDRKKVCTVKPVAVHQNVTFVIDLKHNIIVAARRFSSHNASVLMRNILGVNLRYLQRETGIEITVMAICDGGCFFYLWRLITSVSLLSPSIKLKPALLVNSG